MVYKTNMNLTPNHDANSQNNSYLLHAVVKPVMKRKQTYIPHAQRTLVDVTNRNLAERRRMNNLNNAYKCLQQHLPGIKEAKKRVPKERILTEALQYIGYLSAVLDDSASSQVKCEYFSNSNHSQISQNGLTGNSAQNNRSAQYLCEASSNCASSNLKQNTLGYHAHCNNSESIPQENQYRTDQCMFSNQNSLAHSPYLENTVLSNDANFHSYVNVDNAYQDSSSNQTIAKNFYDNLGQMCDPVIADLLDEIFHS